MRRFPLAATLLVPSATATGGPNLDLVLRGPSGAELASGRHVPGAPPVQEWPTQSGRQEELAYRPSPGAAGAYTLDVIAVDAGAAYSLDISRAPAPPVPVASPAIAGEPRVGVPLSATAGAWAGASATTELRWEACTAVNACTPVAGATGAGFTPGAAQAGRMLRVVVEAQNLGGSRTAESELTAPVAPGLFAPLAAPTVAGSAAVGAVLTAAGGDWDPKPAQSTLEWLRCSGDDCSAPVGTGSTQSSRQPTSASGCASARRSPRPVTTPRAPSRPRPPSSRRRRRRRIPRSCRSRVWRSRRRPC